MAWGSVGVFNQRKRFVEAVLAGNEPMAHLCRQYDISRQNGYKWLKRYLLKGDAGLLDESRAPLTQPQKTDVDMERRILEVKFKYPTWGPKKILPLLQMRFPDEEWPSTTTIGSVLKKQGLVKPRRYRRGVPGRTEPLKHCQEANDVWCTDFKGWFLTGDNKKCEPFTLTDGATRFLLRCLPLYRNDSDHVWAVLDIAFREYGLPKYLRNDNGSPFGSCGAGRLTPLSIKLIKAGVIPEWIDPGKPQQNGRHERMHQTLKKETANPPEQTFEQQIRRFKEFIEYFNYERPHEALGQVTPGSVYTASSRVWHGNLKSPEYPSNYQTRTVKLNGLITWHQRDLFIGRALAGEPIGIKEEDDGCLTVEYGPIKLGVINHKEEFHRPEGKKRRKPYCRVVLNPH